jgi:glutamine synthetase
MPHISDPAEASEFLEKHPEVRAIELLIPDLNGILRGKRIERSALHKIYHDGLCLPGSLFGADITGDTAESTGLGFETGDMDQLCWPVTGSLKRIPWRDKPMAQVLLTMHELDDTPYVTDPQQVLRNTLQGFEELGLRPQVAVELEFYLIDQQRNGYGAPQPPISPVSGEREGSTQVYGISELDDFRALFDDIARAAEVQALPAETAVAEYAPGQYEVNLAYQTDVATACHHAILLKRLIKAITQRHGMEATFMAKPYSEYSGSGTHVHISMLDQRGDNIFSGNSEFGSEQLHHAIGGLLACMSESMAIFAPNANSYRRFQADTFAPVSPTWGWNNRTVAVRIPTGADQARRLEHRVAGADANPYLLVATLLAAIHHGISNKTEPGKPITGNAYEQAPASLPCHWHSALESFANRSILADYLDPGFCKVYLASKQEERQRFESQVSPLEHQWYLRLV